MAGHSHEGHDAAFGLAQQLESLVSGQLSGLSPVSFLVVFGAGLLTSLSPCTLSVLPLTIGYIGGFTDDTAQTAGAGADGAPRSAAAPSSVLPRALVFALGLASTLAALGIVSTYVGRAYGSIGSGLPIAVSGVAILMGLNLLGALPLRLPSLDMDVRQLSLPPLAQAYLAGLTFALVASPCSTPVLATLLAYVATAGNPVAGGALLLCYTSGYVGPLLAAAAFTGSMKQILALRSLSGWITPTSGVLLVCGGTYGLLSRVIPA